MNRDEKVEGRKETEERGVNGRQRRLVFSLLSTFFPLLSIREANRDGGI
jgi:hypothetical protein